MPNPSIYSVEEKNRLTSNVPWLIALKVHVVDPATGQIVDYVRLVKNDENVQINGEWYEAVPFEIDIKRALGQMPSVQITVQDQKQLVASRMDQYQGGVGSKVDLMIFPAPSTVIEDIATTEYFEITGAGAGDYVATWELGVENPLTVTFPSRKQYADRCAWSYRDENCEYAGPLESCDYTLNGPNGCRAHENSPNFGGQPGIRN